jgi:hypothetical protein
MGGRLLDEPKKKNILFGSIFFISWIGSEENNTQTEHLKARGLAGNNRKSIRGRLEIAIGNGKAS